MSDLRFAARNFLNAFGGDIPDWLREEASALETALLIEEGKAPSFITGPLTIDHAPRFVDDGKPKLPGQLPHETYQGAQDRRAGELMGIAYDVLSDQPPCTAEVDMRDFQSRVFEAGLVEEYKAAMLVDYEGDRVSSAASVLAAHWNCQPQDVARRVALHGVKL